MIRPTVLGAPGVYRGRTAPVRRLTSERLDACAFLGVAPRGPSRLPASDPAWVERRWEGGVEAVRTVAVPVESWEEYRRHFGGFEGPGLLPYAVSSFFEQGGRRAWVARVVHHYGSWEDHEGVATGPVPGLFPAGERGVRFVARVGGTAGNGIEIELSWHEHPLNVVELLDGGGRVRVDADPTLTVGALLRATAGGTDARFLRVASLRPDDEAPGGAVAVLDGPELDPASQLAVLEGRLEVRAPGAPVEVHAALGPSPDHPRWIAAVVEAESVHVRPDRRWIHSPLLPGSDDPASAVASAILSGGAGTRPARGTLAGFAPAADGLWLLARNEGSWGDGLRATARLDTSGLLPVALGADFIDLDASIALPVGALLRFGYAGGDELRRVDAGEVVWSEAGRVLRATLDAALPAAPVSVEVLELRLELRDVGDDAERREVFDGLGLDPAHPRWIGKVLALESELARPDEEWMGTPLIPSPTLLGVADLEEGVFTGGLDRYAELVPEDLVGAPYPGPDEVGGDGVTSFAGLRDPAMVLAPDLYSPHPLAPRDAVGEPGAVHGPDFEPCLPLAESAEQAEAPAGLDGLHLDPSIPADRAEIIRLQLELVSFAERRGDLHALLSVPPGLRRAEALEWRTHFRSWQAAAYHPWVLVSESRDGRRSLVRVPPAAVAAGVIARSEELHGVPHGPANLILEGVVDLDQRVSESEHDTLHPVGINVLAHERDGIRLTGARTLSPGARYRQLSVRRLVILLLRTLERQMQWTVFEPNGRRLRRDVEGLVTQLLRQLYSAGAFTGASEEEAFFVRCDDELNPPRVADAGRLVCQVGIAPAEPLEFLVLELVRGGDGTLRVEGAS